MKFLIIFLLLTVNVNALELKSIDRLKDIFKNNLWEIKISEINGENVYSFNSNKLLIPASTLKVITTVYALEQLGPNYQFKTEILKRGKIEKGVLYGDIYIKGFGDMTLGSSNFGKTVEDVFNEIKEILIKNGINKIKGEIIVDSSLLVDFQSPSWEWQDIGNYYAARVTALSINDNSYSIYFKTSNIKGGPTEIIKIEPKINVYVENYVITADTNSGDNAYIYGNPYTDKIVIKGTLPAGRESFRIKGSIPDPVSYFAGEFYSYLNKNGFEPLSYRITETGAEYKKFKLVGKIYSPPLKDIVKVTNKKSFNFYAESLIRFAGIKQDKIGLDENLRLLGNFLNNIGINEFNVEDGSGLSRRNLFSCDGFIKLLNYAGKKKYFDEFYDSLVYPMDDFAKGHIKRFAANRVFRDKIRIKSGSLNRVRGYVGYLDKGKKRYSFCFMVNNYQISASDIDILLEDVLEEFYNAE